MNNKRNRIKIILFIILFQANLKACELEKHMLNSGVVDIQIIDSTLKANIINATTDNMLGFNSYDCLTKCYLQYDAAIKLKKAQNILKQKYPKYSLMILEGTRPRSVQQKMYNVVKNSVLKHYVAEPSKGSMHNYGTAVDITIVDDKNKELKMGQPDPRKKIIGKSGIEIKLFIFLNKPNKKEMTNRKVLNDVMVKAGFRPISYEWWHFDAFPKDYVRKTFKIIE